MFRYLAVIWNVNSAAESRNAALIRRRMTTSHPTWKTVFDKPGMVIACPRTRTETDTVIELTEGAGVVLGTMFCGATGRRVEQRSFNAGAGHYAHRLLDTHGRAILCDHWGSYVLFLRHPSNNREWVFRSPMSTLACFHSICQGVHLFFSVVEDCISLRLLNFSIDWNAIRAQSSYGDYLTRQTSIQEIESVECGECIETTRASAVRKTYWSPCDAARTGAIVDFPHAVATLRETTEHCVDAWAGAHRSILHTLSGGLDSSIVLSCLARSRHRPQITCVTDYSPHPVGDERRYARGMAEQTRVDLIERERSPGVDLAMFLTCARTARPVLDFSACHNYFANVALARASGASAIFNGELGDNVFGSVGGGHDVVAEYFNRQRFRLNLRLLDVGLDLAQLTGVSLWSTLYLGIRHALTNSRASFWSSRRYARRVLHRDIAEKGLIAAEALAAERSDFDRLIHPWLRDISDVPLGKFSLIHALMVMTSTACHPPFGDYDDPPIVAPLAGQPLVECALRIASHLNINDGVDRAVARAAFNPYLTEAVLQRTGKGGPDYWIRDVVAKNRAFLRETLLDGILVKERILDVRKIEAVLSGAVSNSLAAASDVFVQLYIESWLRRWSDMKVSAVA